MADPEKIPLSLLLRPARSMAQIEAVKEAKVPSVDSHRVRKEMRARLVAQEYVRNGMDFTAAWKAITGSTSGPTSVGMMKTLGNQTDIFMDEVSKMVDKSDIDREKALGILWTMVNTSVLDFLDDDGNVLPIYELKKLPRVAQLMISEVEVSSFEAPVYGPDGKTPMLDDNGSPYVVRKQKVKIKLPERLAAMQQLAQIMRWVGPAVNLNINLNVGRLMSEADERASRTALIYDQATQTIVDP